MAIIGIDLGTTNSLAAVWQQGQSRLIPNSFQEMMTPSVVSVDESGTVYVGKIAKERLITHPEQTASLFKRFMGTKRLYELSGRVFTPEELSALVLAQLKTDAEAFLGEPVTEAVVSVPAYFNDKQRAATKRAGELAGLKVNRLVNEPSAAALACRKDQEERSFLVFDLGGGTLDVSLVDCFDHIINIIAVSGDNHLGGRDIDHEIVIHYCEVNQIDFAALTESELAVLYRQAEQCKMALSKIEKVIMTATGAQISGQLLLTQQTLFSITEELCRRMALPVRRVFNDTIKRPELLDQVVLVGGSCHMPLIRGYIRHLLKKEPLIAGRPDTLVALGAGIYAGMKARQEEIRELVLTDVCPFTLGIAIYNKANPSLDRMSPIIERNSALPSSKVDYFYTVSPGQTQIQVQVYQGEAPYCRDNLKLGELFVEVPPGPAGRESIQVRFTYDINGILEVEVVSTSTGTENRLLLVDEDTYLTKEQIQEKLEALAQLKRHPRQQEDNLFLLARAERLYQETRGETRRKIGEALAAFNGVLESQEPYAIQKAQKKLEAQLQEWEQETRWGMDFDHGAGWEEEPW